MSRAIEVRHGGGLVYLDGHGMTVAEVGGLVRALEAAARDAKASQFAIEREQAHATTVARLEATGLTHITVPPAGYVGGSGVLFARRDGLPVIVSARGEEPARWPGQLGDGPELEARVYGGRKWRPISQFWLHERVRAWRVKP